jgi:hypothetical protein
MNDQLKKERSPNFPKLTLSDAIESTKKLYEKAGKAKITGEAAVVALGYKGLNGAALTTLGALSQYGLIERERGENVAVSPSAIKLIHPIDKAQEEAIKRELALKPKVFGELHASGFFNVDQQILANHLRQNNFTSDGAEKAASVYLANFEFAKLAEHGKDTPSELQDDKNKGKQEHEETQDDTFAERKPVGKVLAKYSIPLGANEATLVFTGSEALSTDHFEALKEYVDLFKKQWERKTQSAPVQLQTQTDSQTAK